MEAAYAEIVALEQEVAAAEAQRASFSARAAESISYGTAHPRGPSAALTSSGRTGQTSILTVHRQGSMPRRGLRVLAEATLRP